MAFLLELELREVLTWNLSFGVVCFKRFKLLAILA
jgi:hypothetical protein